MATAANNGIFTQTLARYGLPGVSVVVTSTQAQQGVDGQCQTKWHSFCLDGSGLTVAGVRGIIAGGVIFIVLCIIAAIWCCRRMKRRRRYYDY
ncbi:hypothetical protein WJX73_006745 [Symbiochloris irregularis]|uniref:Uncharacterized protein n=1 Tax=Symbiochloris irregularis TaxID=706552 RepID=A0AAW1P0Y2_9CHLO